MSRPATTPLQTCQHGHAFRILHQSSSQAYHDGMEDQLGILGLVLNIIVLHNTRYLGAVLDHLRGTGYPVNDEDAARLSPFQHRHIQMRGRYAFQVPDFGDQLRPLRDPDSPDDDHP